LQIERVLDWSSFFVDGVSISRVECRMPLRNDRARSLQSIILGFSLIGALGCGPGTKSDPAPESGGGTASLDYPRKTVVIVCPWSAGGGTDRLSRYMADRLNEAYGKPFIVQNRTGGGGAVGHSAGALAKPDGHTILMATFELSTMHWMGISELTWEDYDWLAQLNADAAAILVKQDAPWRDLKELIARIKSGSGKLKMSGTATGGAWDLARAGMMQAAGLKADSIIWSPTKGSAPAIVELLGGHIDAVCCSVPEAAAQIEAGELRVLAVMSDERLEDYPDYPTVRESGIEWTAVGWRGLALPKGTPAEIVSDLQAKVSTIVESAEFKGFMKKNGFDVTIRESAEFAEFLKTQDAQWKGVIEAAGYAK